MRASLTTTVIGALLLAAGCQPPAGEAGETAGAGTAAVAPAPVPHEDARFLVRGSGVYLVNVRYVGLIGESVIAVRQGAADADQGWPVIALTDARRAPLSLPFGAEAWRAVALEIAEAVRQQQGICPEGRQMQLLHEGGEVRTMYRENRQAWVVFAACPGSQAG